MPALHSWRRLENGAKEDYLLYNVEFAKLGYVTASVQYRFSPEFHFPAAVQDVKCAIVFLKTHAKEYGIDPKNIAVIGGSAGGHLALMAAYAQDPALECQDCAATCDSTVKAVVNFYGVVDCTTPVAQNAKEVTNFIGKTYAEAPEAFATASPLHHLDKNDPPTLTFHGTIDELVPIAQADTLHASLKELGVDNYLDRVEGWPHTMDMVKPVNDHCRYVMERFFKKYLYTSK